MSFRPDPNDELIHPEESSGDFHLAHYWAVVMKYRLLIAGAVGVALIIALIASLLSPRTYRATTVLNVEKDRPSMFEVGNRQIVAASDPEFLPTQTRLMRGREVAERVEKRLRSAAAPGAEDLPSAGEIQAHSEAVPLRGTTLVELSYVGGSPESAAAVANGMAEEYIQWTMESKFQVVGQASQFLTSQIAQLKSEIQTKEQQLQAYGRENDIISSDPQANVTLQKLDSLNRDYAAAVADRVGKEARYRELANSSNQAVAANSPGEAESQLRTELSRLEREYAEKLSTYKAEWPPMQQLRGQIEQIRQQLNTSVADTARKQREIARNDYLTAQRREESLRAVLQGQKSEAMELNVSAAEYNNLKVEVDTKRALLDKLLEQQAQTEVTSRLQGQGASSVQIVERALPPGVRFRPSYTRNAVNALFFGLLFGVGLAFLREYLDRSLRSPEQVEQYLQLPALGVIPAIGAAAHHRYSRYTAGLRRGKSPAAGEEKQNVEFLPHEHPRTTGAEAYRAFRTALLLSRAGGLKSIVITSSLPGEGKTSTALNLAIVLAQLGKKVLVIDADLHKPRLHEAFRISNRAGLVSVLAENAEPSKLIVQSVLPGLYVMPSGPSSPNPSGLLSSDAMARLLDYGAKNFDHVIVDTPPISMVADAILLGHQCDGVVLCVNGGTTPREQVARVRDKLLRANVRILGVLINRLEEDPAGYGKYYHYYSDQGSGSPATAHADSA
jgi:polysaccharide biosynthesis transport protein